LRLRLLAVLPYALLQVLSGCSQTKSTPAAVAALPLSMIDRTERPSSLSSATSTTLAAGTPVQIELAEMVDSDIEQEGSFVVARIISDVNGPDGNLAIPAGSNALLAIRYCRKVGNLSRLTLGLNRIAVAGRIFKSGEGGKDLATQLFEDDSTQGVHHHSIHLDRHSSIAYKLENAVQLR
jgi:hypothetical protein